MQRLSCKSAAAHRAGHAGRTGRAGAAPGSGGGLRVVGGLLTCTVAALAGAPPARAFDPVLLDHPLGVVDFQHIPDVAATGAGWIRVPLEWRFIEPQDGQFNWNAGFTTMLDDAEAAGLNVSPVVTVGKMWATGHPEYPVTWPSYPPADLQETFDPSFGYSETYHDFIARVLEHYRGRIDRITIENEVNGLGLWRGSMDQYRRLLLTAVKARNDVAPEILILDSGLASGAWGVAIVQHMVSSGAFTREETLRLANEWYQYDVYAPHHWDDYGELIYWINQPYVQRDIGAVDFVLRAITPHVDCFNFKFTLQHWLLPPLLDYFALRMGEAGHEVPPLINNEASNWPMGDAVLEGQNLFKMVILGLHLGVRTQLWYPWTSEGSTSPRCGLLDANGQPTRQYGAFVNICSRLGVAYRYVSHDTLGTAVLRFRFQRPGDPVPRIEAVWWDDGRHGAGGEVVRIPVPPETQAVIRYTYDGVPVTIGVADTLLAWVGAGGVFYEYVPSATGAGSPSPTVAASDLRSAPNPFRDETRLHYLVTADPARTLAVRLDVFDLAGRLVRRLVRGSMISGSHVSTWDGMDESGWPVAAGTYWYRLSTPRGEITSRVVRLP